MKCTIGFGTFTEPLNPNSSFRFANPSLNFMKETLTIPISMARFTSFSWRPSITIPIPVEGPLFRRRKPQFLRSPKPQRLLVVAANNKKKEEENNEGVREVEDKEEQKPSGSNGEEEDDKKNFSKERRTIFSLSWNSLFDPDPDNVVALGLTGILTWASVQVLWQLLFISFAILVAAIKYSFIAALLLFILITLL